MPIIHISSDALPPSLHGPTILCPQNKLPFFWATVWVQLDCAHLKPGTMRKKLAAVGRFYTYAENIHGLNTDTIIGQGRLDQAYDLVTGYLLTLSNQARNAQTDYSVGWRTVRDFICTTMKYAASGKNYDILQRDLLRFERKLQNFNPNPIRRPAQTVRAIPATVIEELYKIITPGSFMNPFRSTTAAWRNYCIYIALLHFGLRRSEALLLPVGAIKCGKHPETRFEAYMRSNKTDKVLRRRFR